MLKNFQKPPWVQEYIYRDLKQPRYFIIIGIICKLYALYVIQNIVLFAQLFIKAQNYQMAVETHDSAIALDSGAAIIQPGCIESPQEWRDYIADLAIQSVDGTPYLPIPVAIEKRRNNQEQRPQWAGDHFWHLDLAREGQRIGNLVTAIYYAECSTETPGTEVLDTVQLKTVLDGDGFFDRYEDQQLFRAQFVSKDSIYYSDTLPNFARTCDTQTRHEIHEFLARLCIGTETIRDVVLRLDQEHGSSSYPLLQSHPFRADGAPALMFDTERGTDIIDPITGQSLKFLLQSLRGYITKNEQTLKEHGFIKTIQPNPGDAALFSREGTLHRAKFGNDSNRRIFIAWLATKPQELTF